MTDIQESVKEYYGSTLQSTDDLKTSACCTAGSVPAHVQQALNCIPEVVKSKYYGCGSPFPDGIEGLTVLDVGCGTGRDCFIMSALVGAKGTVIGLDMTDEQLKVATDNTDQFLRNMGRSESNLRFVKGTIEQMDQAGLQENSVDLVISNCVINLCQDKKSALEQIYRVLKPGGEFYFSDVYCSRRLPAEVRAHKVLWGECVAGALYVQDFKRLCRQVGFMDPRAVSTAPIDILNAELREVVGEAEFVSITYRLFKLPSLEDLCEDYGQVAIYKGTIPRCPNAYQLDDHHRFEKNKPLLVCGNTASMLEETYLRTHFQIIGDRSVHYGLFPCGPSVSSPAPAASASSSSSSAGECTTGTCVKPGSIMIPTKPNTCSIGSGCC